MIQQQLKNVDKSWQNRVESFGFGFHTDGDRPYWVEDYYYSLTNQEADTIYHATSELWEMCLKAVDYVIENNLWDQFHIPAYIRPHIIKSWENDVPSIYGRFDFAYDNGTIKLLEFNADTPTSLFEAGVVQWFWKEHYFGHKVDQFNSIHEEILHYWTNVKPYLKSDLLHFTCVRESLEDLTTVEYLRDVATQASLETKLIYIDEIGWDGRQFVDMEHEVITDIFKLYPWEWMVNESFGTNIVNDVNEANWIEPSWKMILSNKAILAILWKMYPKHRLLLPTYFEPENELTTYVKKPLLSREGANISIVENKELLLHTDGEYGEEGYICQAKATLLQSPNGYAIIGSWVINQTSCGLTFRESDSLITTDKSRFIPHILED